MPEKPSILSLNVPDGETLDVFIVTLADGTRVVRGADQLQKVPQGLRPMVADLVPPKGKP
jgi:hypothetical protein